MRQKLPALLIHLYDSTPFSVFELVRQTLKSQNFWVPPQKIKTFSELLALVLCRFVQLIFCLQSQFEDCQFCIVEY